MQNEGANLNASVAAWLAPSFAAERLRRGGPSFGAASRWMRRGDAVESAPDWSISNRHLAIRNGCKVMKTNERCTV